MEIPVQYDNMTRESAICEVFPFELPRDETKRITVGSNSIITRGCEDSYSSDTHKHLNFDSVNWNDIIYLDIKPDSYSDNTAQKVLDKVLNNPQNKLLIHHYTDEIESDVNDYFVDYFNQLKDVSKIILLEYVIQENEIYFLNHLRKINTNIFADIEIHIYSETSYKVRKWEEQEKQKNVHANHSKQMTTEQRANSMLNF